MTIKELKQLTKSKTIYTGQWITFLNENHEIVYYQITNIDNNSDEVELATIDWQQKDGKLFVNHTTLNQLELQTHLIDEAQMFLSIQNGNGIVGVPEMEDFVKKQNATKETHRCVILNQNLFNQLTIQYKSEYTKGTAVVKPQHISVDTLKTTVKPQHISVDTLKAAVKPQHLQVDTLKATVKPQHISVDTLKATVKPQHLQVTTLKAAVKPQHISVDKLITLATPTLKEAPTPISSSTFITKQLQDTPMELASKALFIINALYKDQCFEKSKVEQVLNMDEQSLTNIYNTLNASPDYQDVSKVNVVKDLLTVDLKNRYHKWQQNSNIDKDTLTTLMQTNVDTYKNMIELNNPITYLMTIATLKNTSQKELNKVSFKHLHSIGSLHTTPAPISMSMTKK